MHAPFSINLHDITSILILLSNIMRRTAKNSRALLFSTSVLLKPQLNLLNILTGIHILVNTLLVLAIATILVTGIIGDSKLTGCSPVNLALDAQRIVPHNDAKISHLTPVLTPAVAHDPVALIGFFINTPAYDAHHVVHHLVPEGSVCYDSTGVSDNGFRVDASSHGATRVNFRLDRLHILRGAAIFGNGRLGVRVNLGALFVFGKASAGTTGVERGTCGVNVAAEALLTVMATGEVRLACIVRDSAG
mmetsp:Transcript_3991/g.5791  ORF Transcript_3991/g.5791 Transcript_3991/m.5791 type:complete len:248 (-) Transcript_3991:549-1292(-)